MNITTCRFCQGKLEKILSLGEIPIVNYYSTLAHSLRQKKYPLTLCICKRCGLGQLDYLIPPRLLFREYHYLTSASEPLVTDLHQLADSLVTTLALDANDTILDIGCNDGTLLSAFKKHNLSGLGIDPAENFRYLWGKRGVTAITGYFNETTAKKILANHGTFRLITATRVLANIKNLNSFFRGVRLLLDSRGVFVAEVAAFETMIHEGQFDSIYHEHYSYFSYEALQQILALHGLALFRVEPISSQGGSLRVYACHTKAASSFISLHTDYPVRITKRDITAFQKKVRHYRRTFLNLLSQFPRQRLIGFGSPAKGVTLIYFLGLTKRISYVVDSTQEKQGKVIPGTAIPIYPEVHLADDTDPAIVIVFAWTYYQAVSAKLKAITKKKKSILIPFPDPQVVSN